MAIVINVCLKLRKNGSKRKIRKTQQHFRGSSFGQGSNPKTAAEIIRAYEYGTNGYALEESNENAGSDELSQNIDELKDQINNVLQTNFHRSNQSRDIGKLTSSMNDLLA